MSRGTDAAGQFTTLVRFRAQHLMLRSLRKPWLCPACPVRPDATLLVTGGSSHADRRNLALLTSVAALVAWTWDFAVQRPVRQGLGRLERRMRRLRRAAAARRAE